MVLDDWKISTTQLVMRDLPGHDYTSARALVDAWLIAAGGWVPSGVDPVGEGTPVGGATDVEAAGEIVSTQMADVETLTLTLPLTLDICTVGLFPSGTATQDMVDALKSYVQTRLTAALSSASVSQLSFDWANVAVSTRSGGDLTSSDMVAASADASLTAADPAAIGTAIARNHGLGLTWVADTVYTKANGTYPIIIGVRKYTDGSYTVLDGTATARYSVRLDPTTLKFQSITKIAL